ncbi:hypothetical protein Val02_39030 [Virgisporangium aliadipatigenens]|uniref:Uncharacterized protein n=1 Tax=Virgisporangium aliadipatigenens TaxID=741659 RepID=A0A8J3YMI4_9ACTN|nr:hypothetical protein [Virgisporangium aliadipatigenens]GIJ47017.1 hypothetical protein Val02_39030 [Virgisporangium aliadipatigenens]
MGTLSFVGCFVLSGLFLVVVLAGGAALAMGLRRAKNGLGGAFGGGAPHRPSDATAARDGDWTGFGGEAPRGRSTSD